MMKLEMVMMNKNDNKSDDTVHMVLKETAMTS